VPDVERSGNKHIAGTDHASTKPTQMPAAEGMHCIHQRGGLLRRDPGAPRLPPERRGRCQEHYDGARRSCTDAGGFPVEAAIGRGDPLPDRELRRARLAAISAGSRSIVRAHRCGWGDGDRPESCPVVRPQRSPAACGLDAVRPRAIVGRRTSARAGLAETSSAAASAGPSLRAFVDNIIAASFRLASLACGSRRRRPRGG
jgi:hypothetical protein